MSTTPVSKANKRLDDINRIKDILANEDHPLLQLEKIYDLTAVEAAHRLGISIRQYHRYKTGTEIPDSIKLLIELGALRRARTEMSIDKRIEQWTSLQQS